MAITSAQFEQVRKIVAGASGIDLAPGSEQRVEACMERLAQILRIGSTVEFFRRLDQGQVHDAHFLLSEAVADRETSFFRDALPFDALRRSILPVLVQRRFTDKKLTIWSLGCSSGQEPFSVAVLLREYFPELESWSIEIHAVDIAEDALGVGQNGVYTQAEVNRGFPAPMLLKHSKKMHDRWHLSDEVRRMVRFSQANLAEPWPELPRPDVVLLRYLLGSWNKETQESVLKQIASILQPDGYLLTGVKETAPGLEDWFEERAAGKAIAYVPKAKGKF